MFTVFPSWSLTFLRFSSVLKTKGTIFCGTHCIPVFSTIASFWKSIIFHWKICFRYRNTSLTFQKFEIFQYTFVVYSSTIFTIFLNYVCIWFILHLSFFNSLINICTNSYYSHFHLWRIFNNLEWDGMLEIYVTMKFLNQ